MTLTLSRAAALMTAAYAGASATLPPGADALAWFNDGLMQAMLVRDGGALVVCVLGTNQLVDMRINLAFLPTRQAGRWVHRGYWAAAERLARLIADVRPTYLLGHSMGGAAVLLEGWRTGVPVIAFAPPRVFWWSRPPSVPAVSVVDPDDRVPLFPLGHLWRRPGWTVTLPWRLDRLGLVGPHHMAAIADALEMGQLGGIKLDEHGRASLPRRAEAL